MPPGFGAVAGMAAVLWCQPMGSQGPAEAPHAVARYAVDAGGYSPGCQAVLAETQMGSGGAKPAFPREACWCEVRRDQ
jgi:hypothetical protein